MRSINNFILNLSIVRFKLTDASELTSSSKSVINKIPL